MNEIKALPVGACPAIATDRLVLRAPRDDDAAAIATLANNWEIARRMTRLPHPYGIQDARYFLREIAPAELAWAVTSAWSDTLLGIAGLVPHEGGGDAELGYWLGREHWGSGIATEAAGAILRYADDVLGLDELTSGCFSDNHASTGVLKKLGFIETGRSTRACLAVGSELPFTDMKRVRNA